MHASTGGAGDEIIVCTALDENYLPLAPIVATSIAASAAPGRRVAFHILYDGPDNWVTRRLLRWRHPAVEVVLHRLQNPYAGFGEVSGLPPSTLFRFVVPEVLERLDRAIYLDADLIVEADLGELYHSPLHGRPLGAALDIRVVDEAINPLPEWRQRREAMRNYLVGTLGFDGPDSMRGYVQAGVALLDLSKLRELGYTARMIDTMRRLGDALRHADQCAINAAFVGEITILDPRWNVTPEALAVGMWDNVAPELRPAVASQRRDPRIIHFAGRKPWRRRSMTAGDRWWRHARRSGVAHHFARQYLVDRTWGNLAKLLRSRRS
ncbi:MAG: hypothetical protein JWQ89_2209 [Devosia sp.]|uniref:glycosyltransferase family 8 protein n=1 Tax=Devosia sp. TaxID=1871048 RepID=UPI002639FC16|nr:glycosyltransferase family 8 protein [Devosia sp.]MDB5540482.1 hypothetical protein [Devosia sp.]